MIFLIFASVKIVLFFLVVAIPGDRLFLRLYSRERHNVTCFVVAKNIFVFPSRG